MTRKDYILLARTVNDIFECPGTPVDAYQSATLAVAERIADALAGDNPRFDREHFLAVVRGEKDLNSRPARQSDTREWEVQCPDCGTFTQIQKGDPVLCSKCGTSEIDTRPMN